MRTSLAVTRADKNKMPALLRSAALFVLPAAACAGGSEALLALNVGVPAGRLPGSAPGAQAVYVAEMDFDLPTEMVRRPHFAPGAR